jgi:hypothetical protein
MTAATTALVPLRPAFSDAERLPLAGFLAGYRGLTTEAYARYRGGRGIDAGYGRGYR